MIEASEVKDMANLENDGEVPSGFLSLESPDKPLSEKKIVELVLDAEVVNKPKKKKLPIQGDTDSDAMFELVGKTAYVQKSRKDDMQKHRYVCLTIFNYTGGEVEIFKNWEQVRYGVSGHETTKKGTPHLQVYLQFKNQVLRGTIRRKLQNCPYFEEAKGEPDQASAYCKKGEQPKAEWRAINIDGDNYGKNAEFEEWGEMAVQGKRADINAVIDRVKEGATIQELAQEFGEEMIKFGKGIERYVELIQVIDDRPDYDLASCCERVGAPPIDWVKYPKTIILMGPSRLGKTEYAKAQFKFPLMVSHMDDLKRFNKAVHDGIVFDDFDFKHVPRSAQIHLTDWTQNRSIHARYNCSNIPKHTKKIVCCNPGFYPFLDDSAINQRVLLVKVGNQNIEETYQPPEELIFSPDLKPVTVQLEKEDKVVVEHPTRKVVILQPHSILAPPVYPVGPPLESLSVAAEKRGEKGTVSDKENIEMVVHAPTVKKNKADKKAGKVVEAALGIVKEVYGQSVCCDCNMFSSYSCPDPLFHQDTGICPSCESMWDCRDEHYDECPMRPLCRLNMVKAF